MGSTPTSKANKKLFILFFAIGVSLMLSACSSGPQPEIVGENIRDNAFLDINYKVFVDCTIYNGGGGGEVEVSATLTGGGFWKKREFISIASRAERKVTFEFPEAIISFPLLGGYEYMCKVE